MFCFIYNDELSEKPNHWFTFVIFILSPLVLCCQTQFFFALDGYLDIVHFLALLIPLLSAAGARKELKKLMCGFYEKEEYESRSIGTVSLKTPYVF